LGRYYSDADEHSDRFMPIDVVAALKEASRFPHVMAALAVLRGITMAYDEERRNAKSSGVNEDVVALAQRFARIRGIIIQPSVTGGFPSTNPNGC